MIPVDLAGFVENFSRVILQWGAFVEMYSDGELASVHLDDGWRRPKKLCIVCKVLHSQSSWHDQQLHGRSFLQRCGEKTDWETQKSRVHVCNSGRDSLHRNMKHSEDSYLVSERDDARQKSDEDVCVHASFMSFIYDYHAVSLEQEILTDKTETQKHWGKQRLI